MRTSLYRLNSAREAVESTARPVTLLLESVNTLRQLAIQFRMLVPFVYQFNAQVSIHLLVDVMNLLRCLGATLLLVRKPGNGCTKATARQRPSQVFK